MARNCKEKNLTTQQSVNQTVKSICDILRRSNCKGAMQYVPELTWILFLRILDEREQNEAEEAAMFGKRAEPSLKAPYRWHDWAATPNDSTLLARPFGVVHSDDEMAFEESQALQGLESA